MKKTLILLLCIVNAAISLAQADSIPACPKTDTEIKTLSVLWQQDAAEYRALCYQAFNIALLRVNQLPKTEFKKYKLAIITDLDETILDNSYSTAQTIKDGGEFSGKTFNAWVKLAAATAVPGAVDFLQAAHKKGISIFYISNRDTSQLDSTLLNLQKLKLPDANFAHMLFRSKPSSSKEERRNEVEKKYKIVLLMGDNLGDFMKTFETTDISKRFFETDIVKEEWGKKFIVLPNSTYGDWEKALYSRDGLTTQQKAQERLQLLKGIKK